MLHILAQELNDIISSTAAFPLLSECGKRMYFPKGIIAQSGEAKLLAKKANGTIGMTVINGEPAMLPSVKNFAPEFTSRELVAYAPTAGLPELRELWKNQIISKNPSLKDKSFSLPAVVPGLSAGLSYIADLFLDSTKPLLAPNPSWDNYELIVSTRCASELHTFPLFSEGKFNLSAFEKSLINEIKQKKSARILLNFPQNPSGYTPTKAEVESICQIIKTQAEKGSPILVISDDAYFGLQYEEESVKQSLFAYLADLHENVLAVKIDGPTKEDFAWGFRIGFVSFACKNFTDSHYDVLQKKLMGAIRSSTSCASTASQSFLIRAFKDSSLENQKIELQQILQKRYNIVKKIVKSKNSKVISALPFNSGYFMSFSLCNVNAEELRKKLLTEKGIGTIAIDEKTLRIAFSSIDEDNIEDVYLEIYETAESLAK